MRISDWSSDVCSSDLRLRQRLAELSSPARRLALLEAALQARLLSIRRIDPRIALALAGLRSNAPVSVVAERCDLSQRHFTRSEEHTSELQSLMRISYAVFCLKKKKKKIQMKTNKYREQNKIKY